MVNNLICSTKDSYLFCETPGKVIPYIRETETHYEVDVKHLDQCQFWGTDTIFVWKPYWVKVE